MDQAHGPVTQTAPAPTRSAIVGRGPRLADIAPWLAAIAAVALFLYLFSGVLMPFVAGIALGYLLDPVAEKLERVGLNRLGAALFILGISLIVVVLALILIGPILGHQLSAFSENLPKIVLRLQALVSDWSAKLLETSWGGDLAAKLGLGAGGPGDLQKAFGDFAGDAAKWLGGFAKSLITGGAALVGLLSLVVVTPVVAFYILVDWNHMIDAVKSLVPPRYLSEVSKLAGDVDAALAGFLRGQSLVCLFLGLWYGLGLTLIGLNYGFLIGISAGFLSFIPYVGSLSALVVSAIVALVQGWPDWTMLAMALGVVASGQFLEGNVLSPKLVGESVGLHPVWLMFALLASGSLFGFTGLIVAVPVAAALGVLLRFFFARYRLSPFYLGEDAEAENQP